MSLILDVMHFVAATLLAVIGFGYEREEECDPVHFQPAAYVIEAEASAQATVFVTQDAGFTQASDCEASNRQSAVSYPVL